MKAFFLLILTLTTVKATAATQAAIDAALSATGINDITSVVEISKERCLGCSIFEIKGNSFFGEAYAKVQTEQIGVNPDQFKVEILEQSK